VKGVAHDVWQARCDIVHSNPELDNNVDLQDINETFKKFARLMDNEVCLISLFNFRDRQGRYRRDMID
jgi:hypothetical protein